MERLELLLLMILQYVAANNPFSGDKHDFSDNTWLITAIIGIVFAICGIVIIVSCTCCKEFLQAKAAAASNVPYETYQENLDSPSAALEDQVIIEPLPDISKRNNSNINNESQRPFRPRPMDFNYAINKGLINNDQSDWTTSPKKAILFRNQMKYIKVIGQGWFGQVVEGELNNKIRDEFSPTEEKFNKIAVKILNGDLTGMERGFVLYSAKKFRDLKHENLITLIEVYLDNQPYLLVYQYFGQKSDLKQHLIKNRANCDSFLDSNFLLSYALDVAKGLTFLHENGHVLSDIACRNCYVTKQNRVKIGDYGVSVNLYEKDYVIINGVAIPIRWCAPETLLVENNNSSQTSVLIKEIDQRANVWSFGVTLWEILEFAKQPYMGISDEMVIQKVIKERTETLAEPLVPMRLRDKCYVLMRLCTNFEPNNRPNMTTVTNLLSCLEENYRNTMANKPLDLDFESKWTNLSKASPLKALNAQYQYIGSNKAFNDDRLEKIDKRNFILTLNDSELAELTEDGLSSFFEYLNEKEINDLLNRRQLLLLKQFQNKENTAPPRQVDVDNLHFGHLTRQKVTEIVNELKLAKTDDEESVIKAFRQRLFNYLNVQICPTNDVENQWRAINEFIDFLDISDAEQIRQKFKQSIRRSEADQLVNNETNKASSVTSTDSPTPSKVTKKLENIAEELRSLQNGKKTSTPELDPTTSKQRRMPAIALLPISSQSSTLTNGNSKFSTQGQAASLHFERVRQEMDSLSDDTLSKMSVEEIEQQYFGFMSPDEILNMLQRKGRIDSQASSSLSSSFFKRPVPFASTSSDPDSSASSKFNALTSNDSETSMQQPPRLLSSEPFDVISSPSSHETTKVTEYKITADISISTSQSNADDFSSPNITTASYSSDSSSPFQSITPKPFKVSSLQQSNNAQGTDTEPPVTSVQLIHSPAISKDRIHESSMETLSAAEGSTATPISTDLSADGSMLSYSTVDEWTGFHFMAASISTEEFQRLQTQLLDIKSSNYSLLEKCNRQEQELKAVVQREFQLKDDLLRANTTIARSKKAKDVFNLEQELEITKLKLNVQEEEFRLQQSTLLAELNKVLSQNELLETEHAKLSNQQRTTTTSTMEQTDSCDAQKLIALEAKLKDYENVIQQYADDNTSSDAERLPSLETKNLELKNTVSALRNQLDDLKAVQERQRQYNEEIATKCAYFQQQIAELNEKLKRKQDSYQMLSNDKERQYAEYKKSLDNVVAKKDAEIDDLVKEINALKKDLEQVKEIEHLETTALNSAQTELDRIRRLFEEISAQNELLQVQLQESLNANDCLSSQLQEARQDVAKMQTQAEDATLTANRRKSLVEEISKHLESTKDESKRDKEILRTEYESLLNNKDDEIHVLKKNLANLENVSVKLSALENASENKNEHITRLNQELGEWKLKFELCQVQNEEMLDKQKSDLENDLKNSIGQYEELLKNSALEMETLSDANKKFKESIENSRQDGKDKLEQLVVLERKHGRVVKDLKKQIQVEKKRADRLQDRLQEILSEISRNRSPGLEDIKFYHESSKEMRTNGDTGSVSSWTVVGGGNHNKDSDRHSNVGDRDSESSVTMIENDNNDLIGCIANLQRQNFELTEKVHMLEESSAAMADDLVRKASVIEQLLKEKPLTSIASTSSFSAVSSPTSGVANSISSSVEHRLPQSLKKMFDLVKVDQSAVDIRDMNKRLQILLEETLTKNMHLQRDLEIVSREVARLKVPGSQNNIAKSLFRFFMCFILLMLIFGVRHKN